MRGSRRSFATRPGGTLPTPLGARPAPIRKNGGALIPTRRRRADSGESLNSVGWSGSLAGAASPMEVLPSSTHPPGGAPTTAPDRSGAKPRRTFRPQLARRLAEAYLIRRTAQGRGRINRKASLHEVKPGPPSRPLAARDKPVREATGAGRLAPPAGGNRPRTLACRLGDLRSREAPSVAPKSSQGNQEARQPDAFAYRR